MLDIDKLTEQVKLATTKCTDDLAFVADHKIDLSPVTILLTDLILLQVVECSLTLAFLERWADD